MRRLHDTNSAEDLPAAAEQALPEVDNVLFSRSSLYTVIGMLTLAVLFCAGVLAYTVRRNDLLKTEYYRLMAAIAERGSKSARSTFDPDIPESVETMGPGPKVEDTTHEILMLLVTRRPISNISHPNGTRRTTTASLATRTVYNDDLKSGQKRASSITTTPGVSTKKVLVGSNATAAGTSSSLDAPSTESVTLRSPTIKASIKKVTAPRELKVSPAVSATNVTAAKAITLQSASNSTDAGVNATLSEEDYYENESSTEGPEAEPSVSHPKTTRNQTLAPHSEGRPS